jgi:hypothetical protein
MTLIIKKNPTLQLKSEMLLLLCVVVAHPYPATSALELLEKESEREDVRQRRDESRQQELPAPTGYWGYSSSSTRES